MRGLARPLARCLLKEPNRSPAWWCLPYIQLAFKQDAHGQRVHYTYTPGGKLETRTWARGVRTTYHYDQASNLTHIDYGDNTPDVHFTYTRLGQKQTVQDAGGLLTYTYRPDQPTALESETRSGDFQSPPNPNSHTIASLYNEPKTLTYTQDTLNRATGFQIGTPENPTQDYAVTYSYDQANRLDRVSSQGYDFVYQFEPMSTTDRLKSVTADGNKHTQYQYESGRDTITAVINQAGPNNQLISHYAYQYNPDGQRTERTTTTLDAESNILNPPYTDTFQYQEDTGGLNQSTRNGNPRDPNTEYYGYDKIGNRTSLGKGNGEFALYDTNALNQYTSIWNQDGIQAMTHDTDGYQLTKGAQEYTWDAENRLIEVRERGTLRARYTYDHQGRRIARWTSDGADERYLYQDWNLIHIYDANRARPNETYTWGRDLSGSLQGAGGVGGLLMADLKDQPVSAWFYHYDANGNVAEITDEDGMLLDWYQYDGFGQLSTMPTQPGNRYRFSTKPQDSETSFYYYGYRYYEPAVGRWLSRDPIGEKGGLNVLQMVGNDCINKRDLIGLTDSDTKIMKIFFRGFNPLGSSSVVDGDTQMSNGANKTYDSLQRGNAVEDIIDHFDDNSDNKLDDQDCPPFDLRITGYSWGAYTALELAHHLELSKPHLIKEKDYFKIRLGLVDPVATGRKSKLEGFIGDPPLTPSTTQADLDLYYAISDEREERSILSKPSNVVWNTNYYQTLGCNNCVPLVPGFIFKGTSVPGLNNNNKNADLSASDAHTRIVQIYGNTVRHNTFNPQ